MLERIHLILLIGTLSLMSGIVAAVAGFVAGELICDFIDVFWYEFYAGTRGPNPVHDGVDYARKHATGDIIIGSMFFAFCTAAASTAVIVYKGSETNVTVWRAYRIIALTGLIGSVFGGIFGISLGLIYPEYYRSVFSNGRLPGFNPIAVGGGLGVSQGLLAGLAIGCVIMMTISWFQSRKPNI